MHLHTQYTDITLYLLQSPKIKDLSPTYKKKFLSFRSNFFLPTFKRGKFFINFFFPLLTFYIWMFNRSRSTVCRATDGDRENGPHNARCQFTRRSADCVCNCKCGSSNYSRGVERSLEIASRVARLPVSQSRIISG